MENLFRRVSLLTILLVAVSVLHAQTVTMYFQGGHLIAGPKYQFEVFAQASAPVKMGSANLVFGYSTAGFGTNATATITPSNYSGGNYSLMTLTNFSASKKSINIELNVDNSGTEIDTLYPGRRVCIIEINIVDPTKTSALVWDVSYSPIYADDNATLLTTLSGGNDESPLPIQLANMLAEVSENTVRLEWRTVSETNNFGFEIERQYLGLRSKSSGTESVKKTIDTSWAKVGFVQGYGTTLEPRNYEYVDRPEKSGLYGYRLKQIDLDGKSTYAAKVDVEVGIPRVFTLYQNYPNPFNPTTTISYGLPKEARVTLRIYNVLGQVVKTLVDEDQDPGVYGVQFDGSSVASGVYLYRLQAGSFVETKKMMILK